MFPNSYFTYPQHLNEIIHALPDYQFDHDPMFEGMNPDIMNGPTLDDKHAHLLLFDSAFESGNLD